MLKLKWAWLALWGAVTIVSAEPIEIQLRISDLRSALGKVMVAAHASRDSFPSQWDKASASASVDASTLVSAKPALIKLELPGPGRYALMVLHDEDGNGSMSKNFIGLPREGYTMGHNPKTLEIPRFDRAQLDLQKASTLELRLLYP